MPACCALFVCSVCNVCWSKMANTSSGTRTGSMAVNFNGDCLGGALRERNFLRPEPSRVPPAPGIAPKPLWMCRVVLLCYVWPCVVLCCSVLFCAVLCSVFCVLRSVLCSVLPCSVARAVWMVEDFAF